MTSEDPILIDVWKRKEKLCLSAGNSFGELADFARKQAQRANPKAKIVNLHNKVREKKHGEKSKG
jgi:hypothetical protein